MADRYWVGNSGNWSDDSHWSTTSGGTGGATTPTYSDNVYFDANSFTLSDCIVSLDVNPSCLNFITQAGINAAQLKNAYGSIVYVYGDFDVCPGMILSNTFTFCGTAVTNTIATNGVIVGMITFNAPSGAWTLQDDLTSNNTVTLSTGTLNTNDKTVTCVTFTCTGTSTTKTLNLGASLIVTSLSFNIPATLTALTINATTAVIRCTNGSYQSGMTFPKVQVDGPVTIYGPATFNELEITPGSRASVAGGSAITVASLLGDGVADLPVFIRSSNTTNFTLSLTSPITRAYLAIRNCTVTGSGSLTITIGYDNGTNVNINFDNQMPNPYTRYWVGNGGDWNDRSHWAIASGGAGGVVPPSNLDNVCFDANSFSIDGQQVLLTTAISVLDVSWEGVTHGPVWNTAGYGINVAGVFILSPNISVIGTAGLLSLTSTVGGTLDSCGVVIPKNITISGAGSVWNLHSTLYATNLIITRGTINTNNHTITLTGPLNASNSNARILNLGTSVITATVFSFAVTTNLTLNSSECTLIQTGDNLSFQGGGKAYNRVIFTNNATIIGSNTINELTIAPGKKLTIQAGNNQTVSAIIADDALVYASSTSGASLIKSTGVVEVRNCTLYYITAAGGATWQAINSVDNGGNVGWQWIKRITPTSIAPTSRLGIPSLAAGDVTVHPASAQIASSVGEPIVLPMPYTITPVSIGSSVAITSPIIRPGSITISPSSILSNAVIGIPTLGHVYSTVINLGGVSNILAYPGVIIDNYANLNGICSQVTQPTSLRGISLNLGAIGAQSAAISIIALSVANLHALGGQQLTATRVKEPNVHLSAIGTFVVQNTRLHTSVIVLHSVGAFEIVPVRSLREALMAPTRIINAFVKLYIDGDDQEPITFTRDEFSTITVLEELKAESTNILGSISADECTIVFDNSTGRFTRTNTSSEFYGKLRSNLLVEPYLSVNVDGDIFEDITLGQFRTGSWTVPTSGLDATVVCYDQLYFLQNVPISSNNIWTATNLYEMFVNLFTAAGLSSTNYAIDISLQELGIDYGWLDGSTFGECLTKLAQAGPCFISTNRNNVIEVRPITLLGTSKHSVDDTNQIISTDIPTVIENTYSKLLVNSTKLKLGAESKVADTKLVVPTGTTTIGPISFTSGPVPMVTCVELSSVNVTVTSIEYTVSAITIIVQNIGVAEEVTIEILGCPLAGTTEIVTRTASEYLDIIGDRAFTVANPFIQSIDHAVAYADSLFKVVADPYIQLSAELRGYPIVPPGSYVWIQDTANKVAKRLLWLYRSELTYDGALGQTIEGYVATEEV